MDSNSCYSKAILANFTKYKKAMHVECWKCIQKQQALAVADPAMGGQGGRPPPLTKI